MVGNLGVFSGRGETPHRRYERPDLRARERLCFSCKRPLVSRSGEMPEPTVIVRMEENAGFWRHLRVRLLVCDRLGWTCRT